MKTNATFLNLNLAQAERGAGGVAGMLGLGRGAGGMGALGTWSSTSLTVSSAPLPHPPPQPWSSSVALETSGEKSSLHHPPHLLSLSGGSPSSYSSVLLLPH